MWFRKLALIVTSSAAALSLTACENPVIQDVTFKVNENLETVRVSLNFSKRVSPNLTGMFDIQKYGTLFVSAATSSEPFKVGFDLNLDIVNDQDYIHYEPQHALPSGDPFPALMNRTMAMIQMKKPVGQSFDVYAYADVLGKEWLGVVVMLNVLDESNFPVGLSVSQSFLPDSKGVNRASAVVFGPSIDPQTGAQTKPGGIGIFANAKALIKGGKSTIASKGVLEGKDSQGEVITFKIPQRAIDAAARDEMM